MIKIGDQFDSFNINEKYNYKKGYEISGTVDLTNSMVNISKLNYQKEQGKKSELNFNANFILGQTL